MVRWLIVPLFVSTLAGSASAQGLTTVFATGPNGSDPTNVAFSFHRLSADPVALALTHFQVIGGDPASAMLVLLNAGSPQLIGAVSPLSPLYLPLVGGSLLGGGTVPPDLGTLAYGYGMAGDPLTAAPSGLVPTLSLTVTMPTASRRGSVSYLIDDGDTIGGATLAYPNGGWWVLGLGSESKPTEEPPPEQPPADDPVFTTGGPTPAVPEPATVLLVGLGLAGVAVRRFRRRGA